MLVLLFVQLNFVQLACLTNWGCGTGSHISGSGAPAPPFKTFWFQLHSPATHTWAEFRTENVITATEVFLAVTSLRLLQAGTTLNLKCLKPWWGDRPPLKPSKVTLFTVILHNLENSIRDKRPFCRLLFCYSIVKQHILHLSYSSEPVMRLDYQILLKSPPPTLLAGSAPGRSSPCNMKRPEVIH